jgi:hypothetical protein
MGWGYHGLSLAIAATTLLVMVAGGAAGVRAAPDAPAPTAVGIINVTKTDAGLLVKGSVSAIAAGHFDATMTLSKSGHAGSMTTSQAGMLDLAAGETGTIAQIGLSLAPGDALDITLEVLSAGAIVSRSHLLVP